jgi:cell division protease FtsH
MSTIVREGDLPRSLTVEAAVEAAYGPVLTQVTSQLTRGLPVLIECEKDVVPYVYAHLRYRLRQAGLQCQYLDGRPAPGAAPAMMLGFLATLVAQMRDLVRGAVERRVGVLPHLDLTVTGAGQGLTPEAREVIPLMFENPELVWLAFKDPSFELPEAILGRFPYRHSLLGIGRNRLCQLVTQAESRKFGREFNPWAMYKYVSGLNVVRLRRLLSTLEGEDYPASPQRAYQQLRQATLAGGLEIPSVDLDTGIGGYAKVKRRLRSEILDVMQHKETLTDEGAIKDIESLIPRGMLLWGPPGTGKTLVSKAMATALGASIQVVSGPELKSRWVGQSEENLRRIFQQARQSAPSIIVFDEIDSFASARGTYTGSGVEHSMVNQLLTEMDGFRKEEMVFVVGTTNFVESIDPALLRPGRFEFHLHIPYPDAEDRRAILEVYNRSMNLQMDEEALAFAVRQTASYVEGQAANTRYSGDHLNALCRSMARIRLRDRRRDASTAADVDRAMTEWLERPAMKPGEERVVALHEAGHAVCSLFCEHAAPIERISIRADVAGALGFVRYKDRDHRYVVTRSELRDDLCILMGGRVAEMLVDDELSVGSAGDLDRATAIARAYVTEFGMDDLDSGMGPMRLVDDDPQRPTLDPQTLRRIEERVRILLDEAQARARQILGQNKALLLVLRDELLDKKVLDATAVRALKAPTV